MRSSGRALSQCTGNFHTMVLTVTMIVLDLALV